MNQNGNQEGAYRCSKDGTRVKVHVRIVNSLVHLPEGVPRISKFGEVFDVPSVFRAELGNFIDPLGDLMFGPSLDLHCDAEDQLGLDPHGKRREPRNAVRALHKHEEHNNVPDMEGVLSEVSRHAVRR